VASPTRDEAYFCEDCGRSLSVALGDVPWLVEEMETSATRAKGVDYRTKGGTRSSDKPLPFNQALSDAGAHLRAVAGAVGEVLPDERVRNSSTSQAIPEDNLPAISRYLLWRVDGLALLDIGPEAVDEITDAVAKCHRLIDKPADRQYLGPCEECEGGRLYARPGAKWARCDACATPVDAEDLRGKLLASLDDRLCTAAEIAKLSTYLGLRAGREQVRKAVEHMGRKGLIERHPAFSEQAVYRFGDAYARLVSAEYATRQQPA
jgi:hypothetical protein